MARRLLWEQKIGCSIHPTRTEAAFKRGRDAGLEVAQHQGDPPGRREVLQTTRDRSNSDILHSAIESIGHRVRVFARSAATPAAGIHRMSSVDERVGGIGLGNGFLQMALAAEHLALCQLGLTALPSPGPDRCAGVMLRECWMLGPSLDVIDLQTERRTALDARAVRRHPLGATLGDPLSHVLFLTLRI